MRKHGIKHVHITQFDDDAFKSPENKRWSKRHFFRALCKARNAIEEGRKGAVAVHCYTGMIPQLPPYKLHRCKDHLLERLVRRLQSRERENCGSTSR